ncbi:MAG: 3'-5' exonuclease [Spirochaetaceae bacterium]|jgi:DNA polymerase-3 subunit epsilon|nr:3'-5' exonuclease [Spirochaetaceae bacterium]
MTTTVIFFDTETNGLTAQDSVLSISAIKAVFSGPKSAVSDAIVDRYERFYYRKPGEPLSAGAVKVNGLTDAVIAEERGDAAYPLYFHEDIEAFRAFCGEACHFVAHNIAFDQQFIPFPMPYIFCTMKENKKVINLRRRTGGLKFPALNEAARFYGIDVHTAQLHGSTYDTELVYLIFRKMLETSETQKKAWKFLEKKPKQAVLF